MEPILLLERLLTEITPGPWEISSNGYVVHRMFPVATFFGDSAILTDTGATDTQVKARMELDMKFVVTVREHLPALLDELRTLRAKVGV